MKKNKLALVTVLAGAVLSGCGTSPTMQTFSPMNQISQGQPSSQVQAQSLSGTNSFYKFAVQANFTMKDSNKDGFLSLDEFKKFSPLEIFDVVPNASDSAKKFEKMDSNKDKKLSFAEVKDSKYFLASKDDIKAWAKEGCRITDGNQDKYVSRDEFLKKFPSNTLSQFISSDKNKDGKLNYSEYEDCLYAYFESSVTEAMNVPAPPLNPTGYTPGYANPNGNGVTEAPPLNPTGYTPGYSNPNGNGVTEAPPLNPTGYTQGYSSDK